MREYARGFENEFLKEEVKLMKLPLAVLLQKPKSRTIYRVDDVKAFVNEICITADGKIDFFPEIVVVEKACRKYGTVVDEKTFKDVKISSSRRGSYPSVNHFYEICRADFENIMVNRKTKN